jgi:hypothetical protein
VDRYRQAAPPLREVRRTDGLSQIEAAVLVALSTYETFPVGPELPSHRALA